MPKVFGSNVKLEEGAATESVADRDKIKKLFPNTYGMPLVTIAKSEERQGQCYSGENLKRAELSLSKPINVGVIFSGGQAPGGHNVIAGIFDGIKRLNPQSKLFGFLLGPDGLIKHQYKELTADIIDDYRNTGGFDMIGSGRTKLETKEQFDSGLVILRQLGITALVIIGGDDSNTNAAVLAEYYKSQNAGIIVLGCPKTIDGDLKNEYIEASFGFDTTCKVYSELIGNIERDCNSARKYWHFIKVMGRSASHIALECALQTHPNICLISEEVEAKNLSLNDIVDQIAGVICKRADKGLNFGTVVIPEGLVEFIPSMKKLIGELNDFIAKNKKEIEAEPVLERRDFVLRQLSPENRGIYASLPLSFAQQLLLERDPHGNVQVSKIATEALLSEMVGKRLAEWKKEGKYKGKFATVTHFFGYEGRCSFPSNFDADYCYSLGYAASMLIAGGKTGYMASVRNTTASVDEWIAGGVPITMMMNMEHRSGVDKPVIRKALVDLNGNPFKYFANHRDTWALESDYVFPGPIQFFGPSEVCDRTTKTLQLEHNGKMI